MICKHSKFNSNIGRFECKVTGTGCAYLIPNEETCPEANDLDIDEIATNRDEVAINKGGF